MDARILYLDSDDEITTAANRVRAADATRVAIVLPFGSRVATSRINFRLLSRDATLNGKRLSVVAGDAATRALAASAGLPVFSTVNEYETSEDGGVDSTASVTGGAAAVAAAGTVGGVAAATDQPDAAARPSSTRGNGGRRPRGGGSAPPATDDTGVAETGVASAGAAAVAATGGELGSVPLATDAAPPDSPRAAREPHAHRMPSAVPAARVVADTPMEPRVPEPLPQGGSRVRPAPARERFGSRIARTPVAIGLAVLALALVVGGVGAYVFLPTATAVIAPKQAEIGPIPLRITADPAATEPDAEGRTVPAITKDVPIETSDTFHVTGKRVEETPATGTVRFRNKDFTSTNTVPRGSIVGTQNGIRFRTDRSVTVPAAQLVGLQIFPASATVKVTAVDPGPEGNVQPNTILVIPRGEDPLTLDVTNPDATRGGKRNEFPRVVKADIDAATKALDAKLASTFAEKVADPSLATDGTTVFPETATLGDATYTVDPATLLGKEVETFDLGANATGTVLAVDENAVQQVAEANIGPQVQEGYELVEGSSQIEPSPGVVEDGVITFPVTITARQVLQVDPAAIEAQIRGKSLKDAKAILDTYGQSQLSVWPDWVGTIPTLDQRVDVRMAEAVQP
ncbi:MAG TPA: baseplate J/gp47 family protein [Candidatus Limnocylindrales bacterium]|nr:baseplate J/gp47 family protein [Candidatus Limnocylindrales bacterium]